MIFNMVFTSGMTLSGSKVSKEVGAGYSISKGQFVQLQGNGTVAPYSTEIYGVALTAGVSGSTITVSVP